VGAVSAAVSGTKEGMGAAATPLLDLFEGMIGESVSGVQTITRLVEVEEESGSQIPSALEGKECREVRGFIGGEGSMACITSKGDGDVS
ncbi:hypothetical protein A2U01_0082663, partial [Trifolium medium]|nr:hypothetical protein [Trifolium medium]